MTSKFGEFATGLGAIRRGLATLVGVAAAIALAASPVAAADDGSGHAFVVNSTGDAPASGSTSDGRCDTGAVVGSQPECTLRAAIAEANGTAGDDTVDATGVSGTIQLASELHITSNVAIAGPGADTLTVRGDGQHRVFYITDADAVSISGLTITNGAAAPSSAPIDAGGVMNYSSGTLTLDAVVVTGNHLTAGYAGAGGIASTGDLMITGSTVSDNHANGSFIFGQGGGVAMGNDRSLTITNSTIGGNQVGGTSGGGGLRSTGPVALDSVTFADNAAIGAGTPANDIWVQDAVTAANTLFGSGGRSCKVVGSITSVGHNLEAGDDGGCGLTQPSDVNDVNPQLGTLGDNGGPTPTYALPATSPAVDAGLTDQTADQRGVRRPQGTADDIGAVERQLDTTAPDTVIDSGPADDSATTSTSAAFAFHATEPGTLACQLDSTPYADCSSGSQAYTGLAAGPHTFSVRAIDVAGNTDPTPATLSWRIHATPTITVTAGETVAAGGNLESAATIDGGMAPTGTVTFDLYGPDDPSCAGPALASSEATVAAADSGPIPVTTSGVYHWIAVYSGDDDNEPATSACADAAVLVTPGPLAAIALSPTTATITLGGGQAYTAAGTDAFGNPIGDVTDEVAFAVTPDGSCADAVCTPADAGPQTVTATLDGVVGTADLTVEPIPAVSLPETVPTSSGSLDGVPAQTTPGQELHVTASGFAPGAPVTFGIYSLPQELATATADPSGVAQATITIPDDLTGPHTVVAAGMDDTLTNVFLSADTVVSAPVSSPSEEPTSPSPSGEPTSAAPSGGVTTSATSSSSGTADNESTPAASTPGPAASPLPDTGPSTSPITVLVVAALLLAFGLALLLGARRRPSLHHFRLR